MAASEGGPLTERVLRRVRSIERAKTVHIGSDVPGQELFFDTFNVGNLKGVGKVWQLSAACGRPSAAPACDWPRLPPTTGPSSGAPSVPPARPPGCASMVMIA